MSPVQSAVVNDRVPGAGSPPASKSIKWVNGKWECEPFVLRLWQMRGEQEVPVDIDPKGVSVSDEKKWLEMGTPSARPDKSLLVPVLVRAGAVVALQQTKVPATFQVGKLPRECPPTVQLETTVEVTLRVKPTAAVAAAAAAGMMPGGAEVISAGIPDIVLKGTACYKVEPPKVKYSLICRKPVPLSGGPRPAIVTLKSEPLPPGWTDGVKVTCALPPKRSSRLALTMSIPPSPGAETDLLQTDLQFASDRLVLRPAEEVSFQPDDTPNVQLDLYVATSSAALGTQFQTIQLPCQALEVCLYFADTPAHKFDWNDDTKVRVIERDAKTVDPRSKLAIQLRWFAEWQPSPALQWELVKGKADPRQLDDQFREEKNGKGTYQAATEDVWKECLRPRKRGFICRVGPEPKTVPIPEEPDLYYSLEIKSVIRMVGPFRARLKLRLGPDDVLQKNNLDLVDSQVVNALVREFTLDAVFYK
jgi:hypothetical protein